MPVNKIRIGIAGAGISGLIAGRQLQRAGFSVSIFEARSRTGGRIQSIRANGFVIEAGPEFIHGNLTETLKLLREYNISYQAIHGKSYRFTGGKLSADFEMDADWNKLLEKMKSLHQDQPLEEFLNIHFPGNRFSDLRKTAIGFAEGFDLADTKTASTLALAAEWYNEDGEQYRIPKGYGAVIQAIEKEYKELGGQIFLDHAIRTVDWNNSSIKLITQNGRLFEMEKLIVSLPIGLLNKSLSNPESIVFNPVPERHEQAIQKIGYGTVIKVIMIWKDDFWETILPDAQFIFTDQFIPVWWTQIPLGIPMLTGWLGGPQAEKYMDQPDSFFLEKALETMSSIFSIPASDLKNRLTEFRVFNWKNEPWSRGAYSYARVGYQKDIAVCRQPLNNRIYFTGEGLYEGAYPGTVEAAITTGLLTAVQIQDEMTKN